jgi:hypothetical protein
MTRRLQGWRARDPDSALTFWKDEFRRIHTPRTPVNNTHSGRIEPPAPAIITVALDELCLHTSDLLASILKRTMYLIGGFGRIVDYKRGRASAAKEQPHREVGTQSHGPRL